MISDVKQENFPRALSNAEMFMLSIFELRTFFFIAAENTHLPFTGEHNSNVCALFIRGSLRACMLFNCAHVSYAMNMSESLLPTREIVFRVVVPNVRKQYYARFIAFAWRQNNCPSTKNRKPTRLLWGSFKFIYMLYCSGDVLTFNINIKADIANQQIRI